ncbi:L,D-transpeptidase [Candidatus Falkowbacteria bacterium]|nr:L,D-transpeptidase [Candidatus Falkowbacteria bacterium]
MLERGMWMLFAVLALCQIAITTEKPKTYGEKLCADFLQYDCYTVSKHQIIDNQKKVKEVAETWEMLFPDPKTRDLIKRINRRNTKLRSGDKIAIPIFIGGRSYLSFSPFPESLCYYDDNAGACYAPKYSTLSLLGNTYPKEQLPFCIIGKTIIFDAKLLAFAAYDEEGILVHWGPAVGGSDYCADLKKSCHTPAGNFTVAYKAGAHHTSRSYPEGCEDKKCAPMPYALFFEDGAAFHASNYLPGKNASHGCVRLFLEDAKWLNQEFAEVGTKIIIMPY